MVKTEVWRRERAHGRIPDTEQKTQSIQELFASSTNDDSSHTELIDTTCQGLFPHVTHINALGAHKGPVR